MSRAVILVCVQCRELLDNARKQLLIMGEVDGMSGMIYEKGGRTRMCLM